MYIKELRCRMWSIASSVIQSIWLIITLLWRYAWQIEFWIMFKVKVFYLWKYCICPHLFIEKYPLNMETLEGEDHIITPFSTSDSKLCLDLNHVSMIFFQDQSVSYNFTGKLVFLILCCLQWSYCACAVWAFDFQNAKMGMHLWIYDFSVRTTS